MRLFVSYSNLDSEFVLQVASLLRASCENVFCFEEEQSANETFAETIGKALQACDAAAIFVGESFSSWQSYEVASLLKRKDEIAFCTVRLAQANRPQPPLPPVMAWLEALPIVESDPRHDGASIEAASRVAKYLKIPFHGDGLPFNPHLFSYEKDIIEFFSRLVQTKSDDLAGGIRPTDEPTGSMPPDVWDKVLDGCPTTWPQVPRWGEVDPDEEASYVVAAALTQFHCPGDGGCMVNGRLYFPEARSRSQYWLRPKPGGVLRAAILVAGGIAPGINAVVDGIVKRHFLDGTKRGYHAVLYGVLNGISSFDLDGVGFIRDQALVTLAPNEAAYAAIPHGLLATPLRKLTGEHAREGGSLIGTSRRDGLIQDREKLDKVANALLAKDIKILYVIGGDGSMKLAHSLWHRANKKAGHVGGQTLSVVGIPKTMDNDILWVWQSFGFMSAVEKARETLSILDTEIRSNPRLCVLQLFGSDSGYVVSHTVAASGADQCDAALIPEVPFSLRGLAVYLHLRMCEKLKTDLSSVVPSGLIVMAETAIPTDALGFVEDESGIPDDLKQDWREIREGIGLPDDFLRDVATAIGLSDEEKEAVFRFHRLRRKGERLQGQTSHSLRSAALRIVSCGLQLLLPLHDDRRASGLPQPDWKRLRIVTNEPRHLLRSIAPTCSDIIMGERLGTLAVENAMAGWTDFMISQWLTEYVLVPLPLVVLGRKRIPMQGMFWRSVLETTGQPEDLCSIGGTTRP